MGCHVTTLHAHFTRASLGVSCGADSLNDNPNAGPPTLLLECNQGAEGPGSDKTTPKLIWYQLWDSMMMVSTKTTLSSSFSTQLA